MNTNTDYSLLNFFALERQKEEAFQQWKEKNPNVISALEKDGAFYYPNDSKEYGRLVCSWTETVYTGPLNQTKLVLHHKYVPVVNMRTGEMNLDCSSELALSKMVLHTIVRPFVIVAETALEVAGLFYEIFYYVGESITYGSDFNKFLEKEWTHIKDIVRTPLYGIATTIASLVGVILYVVVVPFSKRVATDLLFKARDITGRLDHTLHRGKIRLWHGVKYFGNFILCFKHRDNILRFMDGSKTDKAFHEALAEEIIKSWRKEAPLWNGLKKLDPEIQYVSPAYREKAGG